MAEGEGMTAIFRREIRRRFNTEADRDRFKECLRVHVEQADRVFKEGWRVARISESLDDYLRYLEFERRVSQGRLADCRRALERFSVDLVDRVDEVTRANLRAWRIDRARTVAASTVNKDIAILQAFGRWAIGERLWTTDAEAVHWLTIERLPAARPTPTVLTEEDLVAALKPYPWHVRLPILAVFELGDRPGAIYALRNNDIWFSGGLGGFIMLKKRKGREGKMLERSIQFGIGDRVDKLLSHARRVFKQVVKRPPRAGDPVFVNARGRPWTNQTMAGALRHYSKRRHKRGGLRPYTARHSLATMIARLDGNPTHVQLVLGHAKRSTGEVYTHLTGDDSAAAREAVAAIRGGAVDRMLGNPVY